MDDGVQQGRLWLRPTPPTGQEEQDGCDGVAASGILAPSCCCFPRVEIHQINGDRSKGEGKLAGAFLASWKQGSWGCLQHPVFTSPGSPPFPLACSGFDTSSRISDAVSGQGASPS